MQIIRYPERLEWASILVRPQFDTSSLNNTVSAVLADIRGRGDKAILEYEERFDKVKLSSLTVTREEIEASESLVSEELKAAIV